MKNKFFFGILVVVALHGIRGDAADVGSPNREAADPNVDPNGEEPDQKATSANQKRMDEALAELNAKVSLLEKRAAADPDGPMANQRRIDDDPNIYNTLAELQKKFSLFEKRAADDPGTEANKRRIEDDPNIYDSIAELKKSQAAAETKIDSVSSTVSSVSSKVSSVSSTVSSVSSRVSSLEANRFRCESGKVVLDVSRKKETVYFSSPFKTTPTFIHALNAFVQEKDEYARRAVAWRDGPTASSVTFHDVYIQPGCFAWVQWMACGH